MVFSGQSPSEDKYYSSSEALPRTWAEPVVTIDVNIHLQEACFKKSYNFRPNYFTYHLQRTSTFHRPTNPGNESLFLMGAPFGPREAPRRSREVSDLQNGSRENTKGPFGEIQ